MSHDLGFVGYFAARFDAESKFTRIFFGRSDFFSPPAENDGNFGNSVPKLRTRVP